MQHDPQLELNLGKKLRALPDLEAPHTLIPRVFAAIQARTSLAWWQRPWEQWPRRAQIASSGWFAVVALVLYWSVKAWDQLPDLTSGTESSPSLGLLTILWSFASSLFEAAGTILGAFTPLLVTGAALIFICYLACLAIGTACLRVGFRKGGTP